MINELDLLLLPNFILLGMYFISGTKFSWNEGIDTYFNVLAVFLIFLVVTLRYLVVLVTWWLLVVTARYRLLLLVPNFSMNESPCCWECKIWKHKKRSKKIICFSLSSYARAISQSYNYPNFLIFIVLSHRFKMGR